jgi:hypothetical protein
MFGVAPAPLTCSGWPPSSVTGAGPVTTPAKSSNSVPCCFKSRKSPGENGKFRTFRLRSSPHAITSRSALAYGSGWSSTALTTLKIAVLTPTPNASVNSAVAANAGFLRSDRAAKPTSLTKCSMVSLC